MDSEPTVQFNFGEAGDGRIRIRYASGNSERLMLAETGPDLYRLDESSFAGDAVYGNTIRADKDDDGDLIFREIAQRSPLMTQSWILSAAVLASKQMQELLTAVTNAGGMWEQAFGGLLMIHSPETNANATFDEVARIAAEIQNSKS